MIKIGAELVCDQTVFFDATHYVRMCLIVGGRQVPGSWGQDAFACEGAILPGGRLAATGRQSVLRHGDYTTGDGLGRVNTAKPGMVGINELGSISQVYVETNIVLDPGEFRQWFSVRVTKLGEGDIDVKEVPLRCPLVKMDWPGRGEYIIDLATVPDFSEGF